MADFIKSKDFFCKYCGYKASSVSSLTNGRCSKSPTSKHVPYNGDLNVYIDKCTKKTIKKEFVCQYCGCKANSISSLTGSRCSQNHDDGGDGTKYHVPL